MPVDSVRWFVDEAATGKNMDRKAWKEMNESLAAGDTVLLYDISRAGRSVTDLSRWMHAMLAKKVRVVFVKDGIDITTMTGRLILHVLGANAEWQREAIAERASNGISARVARGERWGGALAGVGVPGGPKFTAEQDAEIRAAAATGTPASQLAARYGVDYRTIKKRLTAPT